MKRIILLSALLIFSIVSFAQQDLTLYELRSVPQSNQINASRMPYCQGYVLLPVVNGIYSTIYNEGFNYSDMFRYDGDSIRIDMNRAIERMSTLNDFGMEFRTPVFGFGFRSGAAYVTFNIEHKVSARFTYPKTLAEFIWYGNADPRYMNQRVAMDGLGFDYMQYTEAAIGYARDFNEKVTFGFRLKYLTGHANFKTTTSQLGFTTNHDAYEMTVDGAFAYQAAGAMGTILDTSTDFSTGIQNGLDDIIVGNHGGAIDIGITYRLNNKISLSGAVNDIGMISWQTGIRNGTADTVNQTFEGLPLDDWNQETITGRGITDALDTIFSSIEFTENSNAYTTWLPTKIYLGANYRLLQKTDVSFLSYNEYYNQRFKTSLRIALTQRVKNWLMATVNYSFYGRSAANIGAGLSANAGPIQIYFLTDNVLSYVFPTQSKNFHFRFGLNLTFSNNFSQN